MFNVNRRAIIFSFNLCYLTWNDIYSLHFSHNIILSDKKESTSDIFGGESIVYTVYNIKTIRLCVNSWLNLLSVDYKKKCKILKVFLLQ